MEVPERGAGWVLREGDWLGCCTDEPGMGAWMGTQGGMLAGRLGVLAREGGWRRGRITAKHQH